MISLCLKVVVASDQIVLGYFVLLGDHGLRLQLGLNVALVIVRGASSVLKHPHRHHHAFFSERKTFVSDIIENLR